MNIKALLVVPPMPHTLSWGLLGLRALFGGSMVVFHGLPKLFNYLELMNTFPDPLGVGHPTSLGLAVFAEVFCCTALVGGFFTRWIIIPPIITMAVALFLIHAQDPWAVRELAFVYLGGFIVLLITGPGQYSWDSRWKKPSLPSQ